MLSPSHIALQPPVSPPGGCDIDELACYTALGRRIDLRTVGLTDRLMGETALRQVLVALLPRLRRFAWSLARNHADAEDLLQATCERAMKNAEKAPDAARIDAWTFTMMRNLWISELRKRGVRRGSGTVEAAEAPELVAPTGPEDDLRSRQILHKIRALPEGFAEVLLLVSVEGHTYQETADILGIPLGTVMSRMSAARQKLKTALAEEMA